MSISINSDRDDSKHRHTKKSKLHRQQNRPVLANQKQDKRQPVRPFYSQKKESQVLYLKLVQEYSVQKTAPGGGYMQRDILIPFFFLPQEKSTEQNKTWKPEEIVPRHHRL